MPALVPFINHFGPKIQRSLSFFPSLRSYFSSSYYYNRRSGGVIGTASSVTTGPSLPGADRKSSSNRQSWGNKIKAKSDYLELTAFSSNTVTSRDDNERYGDGRVHVKDLESGLQRSNKVPAQDVDSRLQWGGSPASVRHAVMKSKPKPPSRVSAQDADSRLEWSPVSVRNAVIESKPKPPNKHIESGLQWNPVSVSARHPEIEPSPTATTGRESQSQSQSSPTHHVESGLQWNPTAPVVRHPEIELQPVTTRKDHSHRRQLPMPIKHIIDSPLRMHPPSEMTSFPSSSSSSSF